MACTEINAYQRIAGEAIFEIGRRLHSVKYNPHEYGLPAGTDKEGRAIVARGAWGEWLVKMEFETTAAHRFMKIYEELNEDKIATLQNKPFIALYEIATLPESVREQPHTLKNGETKTPDEMTVRELREVKKASTVASTFRIKTHKYSL